MAAERILIAEDNEKNIKLFRDVLQLSGYETLEASTGEQAIDFATRHTPDLVLMDIRLPRDGRPRGPPSAPRGRANGRHPRRRADGTSDGGRP